MEVKKPEKKPWYLLEEEPHKSPLSTSWLPDKREASTESHDPQLYGLTTGDSLKRIMFRKERESALPPPVPSLDSFPEITRFSTAGKYLHVQSIMDLLATSYFTPSIRHDKIRYLHLCSRCFLVLFYNTSCQSVLYTIIGRVKNYASNTGIKPFFLLFQYCDRKYS